jgi:hypothetical protein
MDEFVEAAAAGDLPRVQALLPGVQDEGRRANALLAAVRAYLLAVVEFLLASGAPPNHVSFRRRHLGYPLSVAVVNNSPKYVALLLNSGATPDLLDSSNQTPLYYAISLDITRLLLDAGADANLGDLPPLCAMVVQGRNCLVQELVTRPRVQVDIRDKRSGMTPLHYAAMFKCLVSVKALLRAGADPCVMDDRECTPLSYVSASFAVDEDELNRKCRIATALVAAGAREWQYVPTPCPGLETALVPVWEKEPEERASQELSQLFRRLEPTVQAKIQETLRALHHGGLDRPLRMAVLKKVLERDN